MQHGATTLCKFTPNRGRQLKWKICYMSPIAEIRVSQGIKNFSQVAEVSARQAAE